MGDHPTYVVGPHRAQGKWIFLCPECDEKGAIDSANIVCTTDWLRGQELEWDNHTCLCFETDPYEGEEVESRRKRFFLYSSISRLLGAHGRRVDLPCCVKQQIEELYGESQTGFQAGEAGGQGN